MKLKLLFSVLALSLASFLYAEESENMVAVSADSNKTWTFTDIDEYMDIDSEQMNCYKGAEPMNDTVAGDGFPTLNPGENTFSFSGGINGISVFPRWCSI